MRRQLIVLALAGLLVACSADKATVATADRSASVVSDRDYVAEQIRLRLESADSSYGTRSLPQLLPNALWRMDNELRPLVDLVVVGTITHVEAGRAYRLPDDPAQESGPNDGQTEVAFDTADAAWRTVHAAISVDSVLGGSAAPGEEITTGFSLFGSVDAPRFMRGLQGLGPAVFFLQDTNAVFAYDAGVHPVAMEGALVATVNDDALQLPFMAASRARELLATAPSLTVLAEAADDPSYEVPA
jgi:hypothetical protein